MFNINSMVDFANGSIIISVIVRTIYLIRNHIKFALMTDEDEEEYVVEGPAIEKMLGYTSIDSEKGFLFFQNFLKERGILDQLEEAGIEEGDTVRMYGLSFNYSK